MQLSIGKNEMRNFVGYGGEKEGKVICNPGPLGEDQYPDRDKYVIEHKTKE